MSQIERIKSTKPQQNYIQILSQDLGFDRKFRNGHISEIIGREIHYLDDISKEEASKVIEKFKEWKYAPE